MYPKAYIDYLVEFHASRDYFECHEILEEYWKDDPPNQREMYWVGFIQLAVALYHHRRKNTAGAKRLMANSIRILQAEKQAVECLGLDHSRLLELMQSVYEQIEMGSSYKSIMLPIKDEKLEEACRVECKKKEYTWGQPSTLTDTFLIDKHRLRDRTDVILEREKEIERRKKSRG
ncbi:DUF309 domain-containing protein [Bacillus inaquosorum]|uniref:DUF309 domain-containing protein n=1 Tax=Bacillus inaquosorum TaxID=483913 RepID=UPI00227E1C54|nr:DUF309 domain-containing protein [Bacillus inaquosorum]MCY8174036.1 DUF309 domain-containing protein [Bacillus inaquosorum]MCY8791868.1 DUF309 domain-containing protein [Bacillus inaquosorum]MCY8844074.1 DUF309 domain-containing protein [Bacillus inaquosorum]MCY9086827.1 DUF309 domain-containing protein [Bacillus inaquosorum]